MSKWTFSALLLLALTTLSTIALADTKTLPGSACYGDNPTGGYRPQTGQFLAGTRGWATCPVVRDNATTRPDSVRVRLTPNTEAGCWLQSASPSASGDDFTPEVRQTGGTILLDGDDLNHYSGGVYFVSCYFYSTGGIASIRWDEPGDGSGPDAKVTPGFTCQNNIGYGEGEVSVDVGEFWNMDFPLIPVSCPIFRNQELGIVDTVDVRVDPGAIAIDCYVMSQDGGSTQFDTTPGKQTSGDKNQLLSIDLDALNQFSSQSYVLRCNVHQGGKISNIRWTQ